MYLLAVFVDVAANSRVVVTVRAFIRLHVTVSVHSTLNNNEYNNKLMTNAVITA